MKARVTRLAGSWPSSTRSIGEVIVPAGSEISGPIYVKGAAVGSATVTVTNLYYAPATFAVNVIAAATQARS